MADEACSLKVWRSRSVASPFCGFAARFAAFKERRSFHRICVYGGSSSQVDGAWQGLEDSLHLRPPSPPRLGLVSCHPVSKEAEHSLPPKPFCRPLSRVRFSRIALAFGFGVPHPVRNSLRVSVPLFSGTAKKSRLRECMWRNDTA